MIVTKTFQFSGSIGSTKNVSIPDGTTASHVPTWARFVVDGINEVLASFGTHIEYDEQTGAASMSGTSFILTITGSTVRLYANPGGELDYTNQSIAFGSGDYYNVVVTVKGTTDSFEVFLAGGSEIGSFFDILGKYNFKRLSDGRVLSALRKPDSTGKFWVFEDGEFLEYALIVKPAAQYAYSDFTYIGYALVPAIPTNFAYRIVDAYLYCPMLESKVHYTIADVSVVAVHSCLLLRC